SGSSASSPSSSSYSSASSSSSGASSSVSGASSSSVGSVCSSSSSGSLTTSPSEISPRHDPVASLFMVTNRRKCFRSSRARRPTARQMLPVFSMKPLGKYSITSSTLVRSSASGWNVTTPFVAPLAPSEVHTMRRNGTCSVTVAFTERRENAILNRQVLSTSSLCSTLSTPLANEENSSNCVHWS